MRVAGTTVLVIAMMAATGAAPKEAPKPLTTSESVKDGVDAWQRGDYPTAVSIWRPLAAKGDADAAFNLAQAYKLGRGVPTDLAQAKTFYGQAARGGHSQAAANYGLLLFQDGDRVEAMPWIQKAADVGDPRAQYVYGTALFNGDLAPRDWPKAYALMTRAAAAGLPQATTSLSQMDQFIAIADRQKGLAMAADLAAKPMPPIDRHQVASNASDAPASPARKVQLASDTQKPVPVPTKLIKLPIPTPRPVPPKSTFPLATTGGQWKVQLGAYGSEAIAKTAWGQISGKVAALHGLSPSYEKAGAFVRLRAGGLADKAGADKACAAAEAASVACFRVAP